MRNSQNIYRWIRYKKKKIKKKTISDYGKMVKYQEIYRENPWISTYSITVSRGARLRARVSEHGDRMIPVVGIGIKNYT